MRCPAKMRLQPKNTLELDWNLSKEKLDEYHKNNELIVLAVIFNHIESIAGIWPRAERKRPLLTVKSQKVNDLMDIDA